MSLRGEGSLELWVGTENVPWKLDDYGYKFGPYSFEELEIFVLKHPNKTLSIIISGPFDRTISFKCAIIQMEGPLVSLIITWKYPVIRLYVQGQKVSEMVVDAIVKATLPIKISAPTLLIDTPSMDIVGEILTELTHIFNTVSAFLEAPSSEVCRITLEDSLDRTKFSIESTRKGSWEAILNGTKSVFDFVKQRFGDFFAVCSGYGQRLAQAHVILKESEADIANQKAKQEKLKTISAALKVAAELSQHLSLSRTDMSREEMQQLLDVHFINPMRQLAQTVVGNELRIELRSSQDEG